MKRFVWLPVLLPILLSWIPSCSPASDEEVSAQFPPTLKFELEPIEVLDSPRLSVEGRVFGDELVSLPFRVSDGTAGLKLPRQPLSGKSLLDFSQPAGEIPRLLFSDFQLYGNSLSTVRRLDARLILDFDRDLINFEIRETSGTDDSHELEETLELLEAFHAYDSRGRLFERTDARTVDENRASEALRSLGYIN